MIYYYACVTSYTVAERAAAGADAAGRVRAAGSRRAEHEGKEAEQSHRELRVEHSHAEGSGRPHCAGAPAVPALPHSGRSTVPHTGGSAVTHSGGSAMPHSGGSAVPHSGGSAMPHSGGSAMPHSGGSAVGHLACT